MKKSLLILIVLTLVFSLCGIGAVAADDQTLSDMTAVSSNGELGVDWVPESLGDDPQAEEYENVYDPADYVEQDEYYSESGWNYDTDTWELADALQLEPVSGSSGESSGEDSGEDTPSLALEGGGYIEYNRRENDTSPTAESSHYYNPLSYQVPIYSQSGSVCWAIAAMTCMQIGSLQKGLFTEAPSLSTDHLVYFAYHGFTDSLCNPEKDYITPAVKPGNVYASVMTLASRAGAVETSRFTAGSSINENNIYSDDLLHLKNASWLSLAGSEDRAAVKQAVLDYGSAALSLYTGNYLTKSGSSSYYNADNYCYCYNGTTDLANDHEVVIVGWDDDYPGVNFPTPPTNESDEILNGAWLCRNSWGDGWGDSGYFWLSYYDTMVCAHSLAAVFEPVAAETDYDNIYQYDCSFTLSSYATVNTRSVTIANVFKAAADTTAESELLRAVSTYTLSPSTGYSITIYTDLTQDNNPRSGTAAATLTGTFAYAGYHTLTLDKPVYLTEGSKYSVVVTLLFSGSAGNKISTCSSCSVGGYTAVNSCHTGESFILKTTGWHDRAAENSNFRIKAFTDYDDSCTHDWGKDSVITEATCTTDGLARYVCADCGAVKTAVIPAGHSIEHVEASEPERLTAGNTEHWKCTVCGKLYADEKLARELTAEDVYLAPLGFDDVDEKHYAYEAVLWAVEEGITTGISAENFNPDGQCNRAQIVTFLWRYNGCPEPTISECPFTDVKTTDYYYKAVLWAVEKGITTGTSATKFSPKKSCTRADVVTFLWRSEGKPEPTNTKTAFTDLGSKSSYYYKAVLWAVEKGITTGISKTQFKPGNPCKRVQAVTFLSRLDKLG